MTIPATMRALRQTSLNGPQDLRLITDAKVPAAGPGDVLIRVTAAGVNFGDISQAHGTFLGGPQPPYLAGFEAAGEIVATGEDVTGFEPGARVIGAGLGCGAFAEYTALPAAATMPVPAGWTEEESLGLAVNCPTAVAALRPLGRIAAGQTVLIHAAAGGTGQAAVTVAKHYGATVIATASRGKHGTVRALGADHVLDSRGAGLAAEALRLTGGAGVDLVLESAGGATLDASLRAAKRGTGRVIVYGMAGGEAPVTNWDLIYKHQVHIIGLNIGVLMQAAPQLAGEVMIATNGCLTELAKRSRRTLPSGLCGPEPDPGTCPEDAGGGVDWLQPAPDAMVLPDSADPAAIVAAREVRGPEDVRAVPARACHGIAR